jgi:hypothetical protein
LPYAPIDVVSRLFSSTGFRYDTHCDRHIARAWRQYWLAGELRCFSFQLCLLKRNFCDAGRRMIKAPFYLLLI